MSQNASVFQKMFRKKSRADQDKTFVLNENGQQSKSFKLIGYYKGCLLIVWSKWWDDLIYRNI